MTDLIYILPANANSNCVRSIMLESDAMLRMDVAVSVAINAHHANKLRPIYDDLPNISRNINFYDDIATFERLIADLDPRWIVATDSQTAKIAASFSDSLKDVSGRIAYHIHDYEPLFHREGSDKWFEAYKSYELVTEAMLFTKSKWLQKVVRTNHNVDVHLVEPCIDHQPSFPSFPRMLQTGGVVRICATITPTIPRRAPRRTTRVLNRLHAELGNTIQITTFGCAVDDLRSGDLRSQWNDHRGILPRSEIAALFRSVDLFLDLSDYRAFGHSAIEAMSTGAVAVAPKLGGAGEFILDGENSFLVDTRDDHEIIRAVTTFLDYSHDRRRAMRLSAIDAGYKYSVERAALSKTSLLFG